MIDTKYTLHYLVIFIIIFVLYKQYRTKEGFGGNMNYLDQHAYMKCCRSYGCHSHRCRRFLKNRLNENKPLRVGYLKHIDGAGKEHIISLYRQKDYRNVNKQKYFYEKVYGHNSHYEEIKTKTDLFDNDPIMVNNKEYKVTMFDSGSINYYYPNEYKKFHKHRKIQVPKIIFSNYNYVGVLENIHVPGIYYLYGKMIDYHRKLFKYLILKKKGRKIYVVSKMNYQNQFELGDMINVKIGNSLYTPFTITN